MDEDDFASDLEALLELGLVFINWSFLILERDLQPPAKRKLEWSNEVKEKEKDQKKRPRSSLENILDKNSLKKQKKQNDIIIPPCFVDEWMTNEGYSKKPLESDCLYV